VHTLLTAAATAALNKILRKRKSALGDLVPIDDDDEMWSE